MTVSSTAAPITTPSPSQLDGYPEIIAAPDGFWVTFNRSEGTGSGIFAQRFDLQGQPMGPVVQVAPIVFGNAAGVSVFGVSTQDAKSHEAFIDKHDLPFPLVVDDRGEVARAFRVPVKGEYAARQSFLIGADGKVAARFDNIVSREALESLLQKLPPMKP